MTTEEFIVKARAVHGDKYDYSKVEYVNSYTKVCIICPEHGEFWQRPHHHIDGHGCAKCAHTSLALSFRVWTKERCLSEAHKYNSRSEFKTNCKPAYDAAVKYKWLKEITWQSFKINITKEKSSPKQYTTEKIVTLLRAKLGEMYDYSYVEYKTMKTPIVLFCKQCDENGIEHGTFKITPNNVLSLGQGCPKCGIIKRAASSSLSKEEFVDRAKAIHGSKYDYTNVVYKGHKRLVSITCPIHGEFRQRPAIHLKGHGCPFCAGNAKKWDKETCRVEAQKYKYLADFRKMSPGAYNVANSKGWLDSYGLKRLPPKEKDYLGSNKCIYAYEFFEQHAVYIGLTNSMTRRNWEHHNSKKRSSVYEFAQLTQCNIPSPKILEQNIPIGMSGQREHFWIETYKNMGWQIINRAKTGEIASSIGSTSTLKWNKKNIISAAHQCNNVLSIFSKRYPAAYTAIQQRYPQLLDELFPNRMRHKHHTIEDALQMVDKLHCTTRIQLRRQCLWAHRILYDNKLLATVFGKVKEYTREEALQLADQYKTINKIRENNYSLWKYLRDNNLFKVAKPNDIMFHRCKTIEEAWNVSQSYNNRTELANHAKRAYHILRDNNLLQERYPQFNKSTK